MLLEFFGLSSYQLMSDYFGLTRATSSSITNDRSKSLPYTAILAALVNLLTIFALP